MLYMKIISLIIVCVSLLAGCVSTKKYEASLNDISTLESEKTNLLMKLNETSNRLDEVTDSHAALESEAARLRSEIEELNRQKASLFELNNDLNQTVARLSGEKLSVLKEKESAITRLSEEKMQAIQERERAIAEMRQTHDSLVSALNEEIKKGEIAVTQLKDKLSLSMVDKILFDSGRADIKQNGKSVLDRVAEILKKVTDKQIRIEGHTDNVPIGPVLAERYPTNWELSTARSTTVVRYLQERGVDPRFLSATGYSEYRPVDSNETDEGKATNRRIEVVLIPLDTDRISSK